MVKQPVFAEIMVQICKSKKFYAASKYEQSYKAKKETLKTFWIMFYKNVKKKGKREKKLINNVTENVNCSDKTMFVIGKVSFDWFYLLRGFRR